MMRYLEGKKLQQVICNHVKRKAEEGSRTTDINESSADEVVDFKTEEDLPYGSDKTSDMEDVFVKTAVVNMYEGKLKPSCDIGETEVSAENPEVDSTTLQTSYVYIAGNVKLISNRRNDRPKDRASRWKQITLKGGRKK